MLALMVDTETGSSMPNALVLQVGFCGGDLLTGEITIPATRMFVTRQPHASISESTLAWWAEQDPELRRSVWHPSGAVYTPTEVRQTIGAVLTALGTDGYDTPTVWCGPASFDFPILKNMWGGEMPWHYHNERCYSTLKRMFDPVGELLPENLLAHDAASDAQAQWLHLSRIVQKYPILQGAF
jgi:hypothetical protein